LQDLELRRKKRFRQMEDLGDFRRGTISVNYRVPPSPVPDPAADFWPASLRPARIIEDDNELARLKKKLRRHFAEKRRRK